MLATKDDDRKKAMKVGKKDGSKEGIIRARNAANTTMEQLELPDVENLM